jgi:hypothetical protein
MAVVSSDVFLSEPPGAAQRQRPSDSVVIAANEPGQIVAGLRALETAPAGEALALHEPAAAPDAAELPASVADVETNAPSPHAEAAAPEVEPVIATAEPTEPQPAEAQPTATEAEVATAPEPPPASDAALVSIEGMQTADLVTEPEAAAPEPVEPAPLPAEFAPEPMELTPAPVELAPEPVEPTPEPDRTLPEIVEAPPSAEALRTALLENAASMRGEQTGSLAPAPAEENPWAEEAVACPRGWVTVEGAPARDVPPGCDTILALLPPQGSAEDAEALHEAATTHAEELAALLPRLPKARPDPPPQPTRARVRRAASSDWPDSPPPNCGSKHAYWRFVDRKAGSKEWYCK